MNGQAVSAVKGYTAYEIDITWNCNLRCAYCYERHPIKNNNIVDCKTMSPEVMDETINFIMNTYDVDAPAISLYFFGGEPFLNFDLIRLFLDKLQSAQLLRGVKVPFVFGATTNAILLTYETIDFLAENKFHLMISIDGSKQTHEAHRGKGTFDKLLENISYIHAAQILMKFRMTVTPESVPLFRENLLFLNMLGAPFIWKTNGEVFSFDAIGSMHDVLLDLIANNAIPYDQTLSEAVSKKNSQRHCIDLHHNCTIAPNGDIVVCNRITKVLGSVIDGILDMAYLQKLPLYALPRHPQCMKCPSLSFCRGGCLGEHYEYSGSDRDAEGYLINESACAIVHMLHIVYEELTVMGLVLSNCQSSWTCF